MKLFSCLKKQDDDYDNSASLARKLKKYCKNNALADFNNCKNQPQGMVAQAKAFRDFAVQLRKMAQMELQALEQALEQVNLNTFLGICSDFKNGNKLGALQTVCNILTPILEQQPNNNLPAFRAG